MKIKKVLIWAAIIAAILAAGYVSWKIWKLVQLGESWAAAPGKALSALWADLKAKFTTTPRTVNGDATATELANPGSITSGSYYADKFFEWGNFSP